MKSLMILLVSLIFASQSHATGCMGYSYSYELGPKLKSEEVLGHFNCEKPASVFNCTFTTEEASPRKFVTYFRNQNTRVPEGVSFPVVIESFEAMRYDDCSYGGKYEPNGVYERFLFGSQEIFRFVAE
ncbi:hypothetical protein AZI86_15885 [Bdellovibrio bacteriovorus]|uniref:Uncharacterized protein n=1 Tax=Bdellovibrio bacteriovorus TaxID=959 RepID=A0A150WHM5_BDEBC|nr:hypothetical protein [Bdellovibrio bacteriovorus]KYG63182.1 hypothetical protein AZI86_15885 [Bdellovibrio bacteriovorus]